MRGAVVGIVGPPVPLAAGVPAAFLAGPLVGHLLDSFDQVLGPVVLTLDDLAAYIDPRYAPDDFAVWVGSWLASAVDRNWPAARVRTHIPDLREALLNRGTLAGVRAGIRACTGSDPDVDDTGGVSWSRAPTGDLPGRPGPPILRVRADLRNSGAPPGSTAEQVLRQLVRRVVDDLKPAHVALRLSFR
jgi:phage tail-like protein